MRAWPVPVAAFALLAAATPRLADDWDAVGFVRAVSAFDLARFEPHPPGYPVYVLAARALAVVARDPALACGLASALGGALVVAALARLPPVRGAPWVALLALASPVLLLAATSARSDALGLGLAAAAVALGRGANARPALAAALLSLALGARPSLAVLVATLAAMGAWGLRRAALPALASFTLVTCAWSAWLVAQAGGVARYAALTRAQAAGHFSDWGGSAWTSPDLTSRALAFARDAALCLGVDASLAGALRAAAWAALVATGVRAVGTRASLRVLASVTPYALVAFWTQNLADEPRHLLPFVTALVALAVAGAGSLWTRGARFRAAVALAAALLAWPAATVAYLHRTREPAGAAAARWLRARHPDGDVLVFGGRHGRVIEQAGVRALPRTLMGEVDVTLERLDHLPRHVYVTDEVRFRERARGATGEGTRFCRDARVDGARACVTLFPYDVLAARGSTPVVDLSGPEDERSPERER